MNITEKIIARASNRDSVSPGDVVFANVDKLMIHDVSGPAFLWHARRSMGIYEMPLMVNYAGIVELFTFPVRWRFCLPVFCDNLYGDLL